MSSETNECNSTKCCLIFACVALILGLAAIPLAIIQLGKINHYNDSITQEDCLIVDMEIQTPKCNNTNDNIYDVTYFAITEKCSNLLEHQEDNACEDVPSYAVNETAPCFVSHCQVGQFSINDPTKDQTGGVLFIVGACIDIIAALSYIANLLEKKD